MQATEGKHSELEFDPSSVARVTNELVLQQRCDVVLVGWSLTSLFNTSTAISETKLSWLANNDSRPKSCGKLSFAKIGPGTSKNP